MQELKESKLNECTEILRKLKAKLSSNLFKIGVVLKKIRDEELYKERHDDFESYLGEPEISFSRATAYKAIKVVEVFGKEKEDILEVGTEKLYIISGEYEKEKDPEKRAELIERTKTLSTSGLKDSLREDKKKPPKHSLSLNEKISAYLDQVQIDELMPDNKRKKNWEYEFAGNIIKDWEAWER